LLVNWDSYPNVAHGGVYTWEKALIEELPEWEFLVYNQLSNTNSNGAFKVPTNVTRVISPPLFGAMRSEEFSNRPFLVKILSTSQRAVERHFMPRFLRFVSSITSTDCQPSDVADSVLGLHALFQTFDYKKCVENPSVWGAFLQLLNADPLYREMSLNEALRSYQTLQRVMQTLSVDVPKVDLVHCASAWIPSLLAVLAKAENGCPVIVTEHGVAYRELLLYYNGYTYDEASKVLMKVIAANIVKAVYSAADIVAPVCSANTEWEQNLGLPAEKIRVIYNGTDTKRFKPAWVERMTDRPVVVFVGRIEVFKDIVSLITAMRDVRDEIPNVECLIYGEATDLEYSRECMKAVTDLDLEGVVRFMGKTSEPEKAYNMGDIVVMSSITEAFPFAAIEAMACGKPVVATDVGGTREAVEGCGILVRSGNTAGLARAIVKLLQDEPLRLRLGDAALKKATEKFELSASANQYRLLYEELLRSRAKPPPQADRPMVFAR